MCRQQAGGHPSVFSADSPASESRVHHAGQSQARRLFVLLIQCYPNKHKMSLCVAIRRNATYRPITLNRTKAGYRIEGKGLAFVYICDYSIFSKWDKVSSYWMW